MESSSLTEETATTFGYSVGTSNTWNPSTVALRSIFELVAAATTIAPLLQAYAIAS